MKVKVKFKVKAKAKVKVKVNVKVKVKVARGGSWGFWGLEKSVKVLRKSLLHAVFFGFGIAGGIDGMRWEMISRNLGAISRVSYSSCARFGGRG